MAETQGKLRTHLFDHLRETEDQCMVGGKVDWGYYLDYDKISTKWWAVYKRR